MTGKCVMSYSFNMTPEVRKKLSDFEVVDGGLWTVNESCYHELMRQMIQEEIGRELEHNIVVMLYNQSGGEVYDCCSGEFTVQLDYPGRKETE